MRNGMPWSDGESAELRRFWSEGLSASQIARALGTGRSRNAVIGRIHRDGLGARMTPDRKRYSIRFVRVPRIKAEAAPFVCTLEALRDENGVAADVLTITDRACKFPIGDPRDADFGFCGRPAVEGRPYCAEHVRLSYIPIRKRERREINEVRRHMQRQQWLMAL